MANQTTAGPGKRKVTVTLNEEEYQEFTNLVGWGLRDKMLQVMVRVIIRTLREDPNAELFFARLIRAKEIEIQILQDGE